MLLLQDIASPASALGQYILESLHTGYAFDNISQDEPKKNLSSDLDIPGYYISSKRKVRLNLCPKIHRELFLLLFEVRIVHLLMIKRSSLISMFGGSQTIDDSWWLKVILSLQSVDSV